MRVRRLDHIVLTVSDIAAAERFYHEVFDMPIIADQSDDQVTTLRCGHQLIRLQRVDRDALKATHPTVGAADLAIVVGDNMENVHNHMVSYFVDIVAGPVKKLGAEGEMLSLYVHDPDQNLIEVSTYKNK